MTHSHRFRSDCHLSDSRPFLLRQKSIPRVKYSFCFEFRQVWKKMQNQNGKRPMESDSERQNQQKIRKLGQQRKTSFKLSKSFKFEWCVDVGSTHQGLVGPSYGSISQPTVPWSDISAINDDVIGQNWFCPWQSICNFQERWLYQGSVDRANFGPHKCHFCGR